MVKWLRLERLQGFREKSIKWTQDCRKPVTDEGRILWKRNPKGLSCATTDSRGRRDQYGRCTGDNGRRRGLGSYNQPYDKITTLGTWSFPGVFTPVVCLAVFFRLRRLRVSLLKVLREQLTYYRRHLHHITEPAGDKVWGRPQKVHDVCDLSILDVKDWRSVVLKVYTKSVIISLHKDTLNLNPDSSHLFLRRHGLRR